MSKERISRFGASVALLSFAALNGTTAFAAQEPEGKGLFLKYKCTTCHAVEVAGVEARQEDKAPDLSAAGSTITSQEWAKEYLLRKTDKDGKKHKKPYKGSEKDLETIVEWLMGLKSS